MFETCEKYRCSIITLIIPVWLSMQLLYLQLEYGFHSPLKQHTEFIEQVEYVTQVSKFSIPSVSLKCAATGDCFSKGNLWSGSSNSKTLASDLHLESHFTSVYKRKHVCSVSFSSQSCANRCELRACTSMWLIILITFWKTLLTSDDIFQLARISVWMTQCVDSLLDMTSLTQVVKPESHPAWQPLSPCIYWHKMTNSIFLICNHSKTWIVLQLWRWLATKVHITYPHAHPPEKVYHTKTSIVALLSTSEDSSTCIAYHSD